MLLARRSDGRAQKPRESVRVDVEAEHPPDHDPVSDQPEEAHDLVDRHVAPQLAAGLQLLEPFPRALLRLWISRLPLRERVLVAPQDADRLRVDAEPRRVGIEEDAHHLVDPAFVERVERARLVELGERPEELPLRREVVEDRAPREADLLLEPRDGRALVAPAGEAAAGAVEDLLPAGLEMGGTDLRHDSTLQNRTDVLLSRDASARPNPGLIHRTARLDDRNADDVPRAAVVRPRHDRFGCADGRGAGGRADPDRPVRDPERDARLAARLATDDAALRRGARAARRGNPRSPLDGRALLPCAAGARLLRRRLQRALRQRALNAAARAARRGRRRRRAGVVALRGRPHRDVDSRAGARWAADRRAWAGERPPGGRRQLPRRVRARRGVRRGAGEQRRAAGGRARPARRTALPLPRPAARTRRARRDRPQPHGERPLLEPAGARLPALRREPAH